MARYQKPPDPRKSDLKPPRPRWQRHDGQQSIPWLWLGLGVVVTLISIGVSVVLAGALLEREPLATNLPTATVIRLTAEPSAVPTATVERPTPTLIPTVTPQATRDLANPPEEIAVGYYARVTNTGDAGLTVRGGPSTDNIRILRASEGTIMLVVEGPATGNEFEWWRVRLLDGTEGWVAGRFLEPAPAPDGE